jgi:hypothetical protein
MLVKVIAAVKADKARALEMFNKGESGFLDRDLYPFCYNISDGKMVATQIKQAMGVDVRTLKDSTGNPFGQIGYDTVIKQSEGEIPAPGDSYLFPKPGPDPTPVAKISFVAKIGDLGCGVGYYK